MITEGTKDSSPIYSVWFDKSVVLLVAIRKCRIPLPCSIVGESVADIRIRIEPGWEMDIRKGLILAVEEDAVALDINRDANWQTMRKHHRHFYRV